MDVSIIIASWKTRELLRKCLQTVLTSAGVVFEIIVVDNASGDGTVEILESEFAGQVKLIKNDQNLGFAKANNQGLKEASGEYILFLNSDTEIKPDTLSKSLAFMRTNSDCGVLGPKMLYPDGSPQSSVRRFPTVWPILLMLLKIPKFRPHLKSIDNYLAVDFDYSKQQAVDQVMGAFMMMPKRLVDQLNGFDERFFIWFEEVDLCLRVKRAGYQVVYNPEVEIIHHGGKSFAQQSLINNQSRFFKSALSYFLKNGFWPKT
jgi:GT2 family glycosyltransferase